MEDIEDPDVEVKDRLILSPSSLALFNQCQKKWKHRYIDKYRDPAGYPAVLGTFVHSVLERLMCNEPEERTHAAAKLIARQCWNELIEDEDFKALGLDEEGELRFRQDAWHSIKGLWELENPANVKVFSTERKFFLDMGEFDILGYIDRVDEKGETLIVTDYKTGKPPLAKYQKDKLKQVHFYALAVQREFNRVVSRARLYFLGQEIVASQITETLLDKTEKDIRQTAAAITESKAKDRFLPNTGPLCGWCSFVDLCEEGRSHVIKQYRAGRMRVDAPAIPVALGKVPPPVRPDS